jgi:hypothetical protein
MIITELNYGSGAANQWWNYVVTRVIALRNGYDFGIQGKVVYKGKDIIDLDFGKEVIPEDIKYHYKEKFVTNEYWIDVSPADLELMSVQDGTKIEGNMQAMSYVERYKDVICEWMKIKEEKINTQYSDISTCVMHLRAGDYVSSPADSLLPVSYYKNAMRQMLRRNNDMKFVLLSDDYEYGNRYANELNIEFVGSTASGGTDKYIAPHHKGGDISVDYAILNSAQNIIMSNSTFAWWAAWTNKNLENIIAPLHWFTFSHFANFWSLPDMRVKEWDYIDREGNIA